MQTVRGETKPARLLLRRTTAAKMLDTSISLLKSLERAGQLKPIRLGARSVYYDAGDIDDLATNGADVPRNWTTPPPTRKAKARRRVNHK